MDSSLSCIRFISTASFISLRLIGTQYINPLIATVVPALGLLYSSSIFLAFPFWKILENVLHKESGDKLSVLKLRTGDSSVVFRHLDVILTVDVMLIRLARASPLNP